MELNILYEDAHLIVCVKPAGIATQSSRIGAPDMVSILKNHLRQTASASQPAHKSHREQKARREQTSRREHKSRRESPHSPRPEPYLAVIHRLDQPVAGILVFAKTKEAASKLSRQLQTSGFGKHYLARLEKTPDRTEGTLTDYMVKDGRTNTSRICSPDTAGAKEARLSYTVTEQCDSFTTVKITLDTGRHHQIRVQMANLGCPIKGDTKYGALSPCQLQLFAYRLSFRHPITGKQMEFTQEF